MKNPYDIIRRVRLTEKASALQAKDNSYVFAVEPRANKVEIRQAIERIFNVKVERVNTMNCGGKVRRARTKQEGRTSDWKKAIITLKKGNKIDLGT